MNVKRKYLNERGLTWKISISFLVIESASSFLVTRRMIWRILTAFFAIVPCMPWGPSVAVIINTAIEE